MLATPVVAETATATSAAADAAKPDTDQDSSAAQADPTSSGNDIIVTGRAGNTARRKVEASYAISTISAAELQMKSPRGVGEALKNVPGFWIESSSGEASGNIRVRGIPNDGYSTITLQEDGLTTQHDGGLGWLNADQSFRMDSTIEQVEVVRGGPSSIFASNAPGATVNFITRKGGDHFEGYAKYEVGSYNDHRVDGWIGGPIGSTPWHYLIGGFYTLSDGQRQSGYRQDQGGQIRGTLNASYDWGSLMFGVKRIDERIGNSMVSPFVNDSSGNPVGVNGFNALYDTIAGPDTRYFNFRQADGSTYRFDDGVGTTEKLTQLTGELKLNIAEGLTFQDNMRYRSSFTKRNAVTPYAVYDAATLLSAYSKYASAYGGTSVGYAYTDNPTQAIDMTGRNGNGLALVNLIRSFTIPEKEFINDGRFQKTAYIFGQKHDFALGGYFAHVSEQYHSTSATALTDVKNQAQLLDIYALDAAGNPTQSITENGILSYGAEFANGRGQSDTAAIYGSDEWQVTNKLRIDGGFRWEHVHTSGTVEGKQTVNLGQSATIADNAVLTGSGVYTPFSRSFSHTGWTLGTNYQFQPGLGLFARYTSAFRLPSVGDFIGNANNNPIVQKMNFLEGGLKVSKHSFDFYATAFRSIYKSYAITDYTLTNGAYSGRTVYGNTKTWGVELEGTWHPRTWFDLHAQYTWQDPRFSKFIYTNSSGVLTDYSNHYLIRVPKNSFRITPAVNLLDRRLRIEAGISYYGKRFSDVANQIKLPSYTTLDLDAQFDVTKRLELNLYVDNVTNTIGLTEGNPRAGTIDNSEAGAATYLARSIFGRSVRGAISYKF
ncbi:TonB-dependent receptor [Sphingomonas abietis]|uniref:TonB-dependent receptor n=1 Tax=Sphingomonas abietis TaxID=3012344 RepID=A0ABY7NHN1_9SPHN|nr:TonB-dependent receptor [Sphingomonas abietis]WBO21042.1 TonB-dependent receptor [Sphingomonas abietis]